MNDYVTDDEQVERIKKWWSENGSSVIFGLVIGIGGLVGWRYWVDYRNNVNAEASMHFEAMVQAVEQKQSDEARKQAELILEQYDSTAYAVLAQLTLARVQVESGEFEQAEQTLQAVLDTKPEKPIEMITRERLAAVQLQLGKLDQALATLQVDYPKQFAAIFEELKGDILAAKGDVQAAKAAYQTAKLSQPGPANPQYLQQKMDDLGVSTALANS